jgi:hypothetical protein
LALHPKDVLPGGWDLRRVAITDSIKHRSILAHYQGGIPWEDTDLFKRYALRLSRGELVRGADSLPKLTQQYENKVEAVFNSLRERGFLISRDGFGRPVNLPHIHIGRGGEILYGTKGNHRLAMAKIVSLNLFPCQVRARHRDWQIIRDRVFTHGADELPRLGRPELVRHPDLADLLYPNT